MIDQTSTSSKSAIAWVMISFSRQLCVLLARHLQLKAARLKAQVDLWLIRNALGGLGEVVSCAWSES